MVKLPNDFMITADQLVERLEADGHCPNCFMDSLFHEFDDETVRRFQFGLALQQVGGGRPIPTPPGAPTVIRAKCENCNG